MAHVQRICLVQFKCFISFNVVMLPMFIESVIFLRFLNSDDNHREAEEERAGLSLFKYWQAFPKPDILCPDGTGKM